MKLRSVIAVLLLMTLSYSVVYAETNADAKKEDQKNKSRDDKKTVSPPKKKTLKEFTPSEEISIDKPVAFPVDI